VLRLKNRYLCFILVAFFLSVSTSWAATYYVDATNGKDSNNGLSQSTAWKTIAKVNNSKFNPGDQILFNRGQTWREKLTVPSSGSPGSPIIFGAYGTGAKPIISGADVISGFVKGDSNIWDKTQVTTQPKVVIFGKSLGTVAANRAGCTSDRKWFWTGNTLSIYATSDPSGTVQAGQRGQAIVVGKSYITIQDLQTEAGNEKDYGGNIFFSSGTPPGNLIIDNVDSRWSSNYGIGINTPGFTTGGSITIKNCNLHHNILDGLAVLGDVGTTILTPSVAHNNNVHSNLRNGITIAANYWTVEHNTVHDNGILANMGIGIHIYSYLAESGVGDHNIIRENIVYNQVGRGEDGAGIASDQWSDYNEIYYNVVYHTDGPGIYLFDASHCRIHNNTVYKSCINSSGQLSSKGSIRLTGRAEYTLDTIIKNNNVYSTETGDYAFFADTRYVANGVTVANNNFYRASGNWYYWNNDVGSNFATFNALPGVSANINSDPLFVSTSTPDFHLQFNSPCINSAVNVGLTQDYDGNDVPIGSAPDIGAYEKGNAIKPPTNIRIVH
jgi:parallel beta-helix repeat protein